VTQDHIQDVRYIRRKLSNSFISSKSFKMPVWQISYKTLQAQVIAVLLAMACHCMLCVVLYLFVCVEEVEFRCCELILVR
jgi:hypothetical protein